MAVLLKVPNANPTVVQLVSQVMLYQFSHSGTDDDGWSQLGDTFLATDLAYSSSFPATLVHFVCYFPLSFGRKPYNDGISPTSYCFCSQ